MPLENSFFEGFYDRMIAFLRSLFESALQANDSLEFAVMTGCLGISKESIFTEELSDILLETIIYGYKERIS